MSESEHYQSNRENLLHQRALIAARDVAREAGIDDTLRELRVRNIASWVYVNGQPQDPLSSTAAIKLIRGQDPRELHATAAREASLLQGLGQAGASVLRFLAPPVIKDEFVAMTTEYLPEDIGDTPQDFYDYGKALAELHNASEQRQDIVAKALPFEPFADMPTLYTSLLEYQQKAGVSLEFIEEIFVPRLAQGQTAVREIHALMEQRGYLEVIMQPDVTLHNARRDRNGRATLIDLEHLMRGPAEFTLGRPLGQWQANFDRPAEWVQSIITGYEATADRPLDPDILTRALVVSKIKFAMSPLEQLISTLQQGHQPDGWMIQESNRRLTTIDQSNCRWLSQDDYLEGRKGENI